MRTVILLLLAVFGCMVRADKWAVLVAGSNGYYNYRHQADICHAYQLFHENGFPDSNIIVMMYDDIANSTYNPYPGVIINKVGGNNVYVDVPKDYVGDDVTPDAFMAVLNGTSVNGKKVVIPSPDNDIFVYFADHGAPGFIAFPNDELYAYQLIDTFTNMYFNNSYHSIVFYLEACESGSMFNHILSPYINIYAVTAATPDESSYACCLDKTIGTYLGDVFSVNFLENTDSFEAVAKETFISQFNIIKKETTTSQVCAYGDLTMAKLNISKYLVYNDVFEQKINQSKPKCIVNNVINSRDAKIDKLLRLYSSTNSVNRENILMELNRELNHKYLLELLYGQPIMRKQGNVCYPNEHIDTVCLKERIDEFKALFGPLTETSLKYIRQIGHSCFY